MMSYAKEISIKYCVIQGWCLHIISPPLEFSLLSEESVEIVTSVSWKIFDFLLSSYFLLQSNIFLIIILSINTNNIIVITTSIFECE